MTNDSATTFAVGDRVKAIADSDHSEKPGVTRLGGVGFRGTVSMILHDGLVIVDKLGPSGWAATSFFPHELEHDLRRRK